MTDILMSIRPEWVELICKKVAEKNGKPVYKKRIEVRKTKPSRELPVRVLIYCTKHKEKLIEVVKKGDDLGWGCIYKEEKPMFIKTFADSAMMGYSGIGKVIGEFVCDRIDRIGKRGINNNFDYCYLSLNEWGNDDIEIEITDIQKSCISKSELNAYGANSSCLYGWHITDLKIYDEPKELSEFFYACKQPKGTDCSQCIDRREKTCYSITRPPQSWCYVEVRE